MERSKSMMWRVTLLPHRSLNRTGFIGLMLAIGLANFVVAVVFASAGAWPVAGFCGLDVILIWLAFQLNFASARQAERIEINDENVIVERLAHRRQAEVTHLARPWVGVELEERAGGDLVGSLYLRSRGIRHEIGSFLGSEERKQLALELKRALAVR
jgi:uncharacterized membrane protein